MQIRMCKKKKEEKLGKWKKNAEKKREHKREKNSVGCFLRRRTGKKQFKKIYMKIKKYKDIK